MWGVSSHRRRSPTPPHSSLPPPFPEAGKLVFTVAPPNSLLDLVYTCGSAGGVLFDTLLPDEVLAGVSTGCANDGFVVVATAASTPPTAPPFVNCVTPLPPPTAWCGAYVPTR